MISRFCFFTISFFLTSVALADSLVANAPWIREAPPTAKNLAGYVELVNKGKKPVVIKSAHSSDFKRVELHVTTFENGMMRMTKMENLKIAPGETLYFEPGGKHFMLIKPQKAIKAGISVPVTLELQDQESMLINFEVRK